jgi:ABC-type lipoprotein export system ATPase subunit
MHVAVEALWHRYRRSAGWVLEDVWLKVSAGQLVAVIGPSGSGKTTLLSIVGGLSRPTRGRVRFEDANRAVLRPSTSWIFQTANALGWRSTLDNVALGLLASGFDHRHARDIAQSGLNAVGLQANMTTPTRRLSGGELQRVSIARTLAVAPQMVLADEPTAQLDRRNADKVADALAGLRDAARIVVVATHDPVVADRADTAVEIVNGRIR